MFFFWKVWPDVFALSRDTQDAYHRIDKRDRCDRVCQTASNDINNCNILIFLLFLFPLLNYFLGWEFIKEKTKTCKKENTHASTQTRTKTRKKELIQENTHENTQTHTKTRTRTFVSVYFIHELYLSILMFLRYKQKSAAFKIFDHSKCKWTKVQNET